MAVQKGPARPPGRRIPPESLAALLIGIAIFVGFAIRGPIFGHLLLDIPTYLAVGAGAVLLFLATFFATASAVGRDRTARGDRLTGLGWAIGAIAFAIAVAAAFAGMQMLQSAF